MLHTLSTYALAFSEPSMVVADGEGVTCKDCHQKAPQTSAGRFSRSLSFALFSRNLQRSVVENTALVRKPKKIIQVAYMLLRWVLLYMLRVMVRCMFHENLIIS